MHRQLAHAARPLADAMVPLLFRNGGEFSDRPLAVDLEHPDRFFDVAHRFLRSTRPGNLPAILPSRSTGVPLTMTLLMPTEKWWGSSYVETARMVWGSKTTTSAFLPMASTPRSVKPARDAASDVIFRTAS